MDKHYTADDLLKLVSNLVADVGTIHTHVTTGVLDIESVKSTATGLASGHKTLTALSTKVQVLADTMYRQAHIILTINALGKAVSASSTGGAGAYSGRTPGPAAFLAQCTREDLDYLVALHGAKRDPEWTTQFYHMCRVRALDLDVDIGEEADNGLEDPGVPGDPDPQGRIDYR